MSDRVYFRYDHDETLVSFIWHGGPYIDVGPERDGVFHAADVINVWDYATDQPTIARTMDAFKARCDEWIAEQDDE